MFRDNERIREETFLCYVGFLAPAHLLEGYATANELAYTSGSESRPCRLGISCIAPC